MLQILPPIRLILQTMTAAIAQRWNKTDETTDQSETWLAIDDSTVATTGAIDKRVLSILNDSSVILPGGYWNKDGRYDNSSETWNPSTSTIGTTKGH